LVVRQRGTCTSRLETRQERGVGQAFLCARDDEHQGGSHCAFHHQPPPSRLAQQSAVRADHFGVPARAESLRVRALAVLVVTEDQAESVPLGVGPLEIVDERPVKLGFERNAVGDGAGAVQHVAVVEVDALRVVDLAVE
jgi:hypothetical protein